MVKIRLKSAHDAVIKMLKSKTFNSIAVDRISDRNDAIISELFRRTAEGANNRLKRRNTSPQGHT